jgi:hypothetical protein
MVMQTHHQLGRMVRRFKELDIWSSEERVDVVNDILGRTYERRRRSLHALSFEESEVVIAELTSRVSEKRQNAAQEALGDPPPADPIEKLNDAVEGVMRDAYPSVKASVDAAAGHA